MFKITCYGVRANEAPYFKKLNRHGYELKLIESLLTHDNVSEAQGADAVLLRGNCKGDRQNLEKLASYGIKYCFTRTVGYNHIDLKAAAELGLMVANVPGYSPNAIAELVVAMAMNLLRHITYTNLRTSQYDFQVDAAMFSKEVRNCKVGIIGTGRIGATEAMLFKGLGATVLGYDIYQSDFAKQHVQFVPLDQLLAESDIVSLHIPYFPGKNDKMVNADFIAKMKDGAILINTARGELQDNQAILAAMQSGKLSGYGTDVFSNESTIFFKKFASGDDIPDQTVRKLVDLYPRVLVTPHVGSNTDEALTNMVEQSFANFHKVLTEGHTPNEIRYQP